MCVEEPELGLHPDVLPELARLLVEASERTQLVITTHSDILVDAMTERPESVVVCEKYDGQTEMHRFDVQDKLTHATRKCSNAYEKGERSFEILGKLSPAVLEQHLPSFVRVQRILNERL